MNFKLLLAAIITSIIYFHQRVEAETLPIIVFFGDSITAGYGLSLDEAYPALIQKRIDNLGLNFVVKNAGVSGDTTAAGLRRLNWVMKEEPAIFVLALGANDGLRGIDLNETRSNLVKMVGSVAAKYPNAKIVIAGMELPVNLGKEYREQFREIFPFVVGSKKGTSFIPFLLEAVAGIRELNQADGIHPNQQGQALIAQTVWKTLGGLLVSKAKEPLESDVLKLIR